MCRSAKETTMKALISRFLTAGVALATVALFGCSTSESKTEASVNPDKPAAAAQKELNVALAPAEDAEKMTAGFEPMRAQLAKDLGMDIKVVKVTDYTSVIEAQKAGKVDVAWYGPLSMVLANQEAGSEPIALGVQSGGDAVYHSIFLVPSNSPAKTLADLKGKKVAFVEPGSTSGNLVPRSAVMEVAKAKAEDFFSDVVYAGSHDAALLALQNGNVDACAIQDVTYNEKLASKELDPGKVKIVWKSADLPQSPLAVRKGLDPELTKKIVASLTTMDKKGVKMDIPGNGNFVKFVPVDMSAYKPISDMAKALGLTKQDMVK
jgi:phosphonate transport system substrate-binding protein